MPVRALFSYSDALNEPPVIYISRGQAAGFSGRFRGLGTFVLYLIVVFGCSMYFVRTLLDTCMCSPETVPHKGT